MELNVRIDNLMHEIGKNVLSIDRIPDGRTNETFIVCSENNRYVARLAGEGTNSFINRVDEVYNMQKVMGVGVAPELYAYQNGDLLMEYIEAPVIRSEADFFTGEKAKYTVKVLKKLHSSGIKLKNVYSMVENIQVYKNQLSDMGAIYPDVFLQHEDYLYDAVVRLEKKYADTRVACHVDNYFGNIMVGTDHAILVDWEYSGMCDRYCDLVNLALLNDMSECGERKFLDIFFCETNEKPDIDKYYLYKMANSFMWSYWHLIKLNQNLQVDYNGRRWQERLRIAVDCFNKYGGTL